MPIDHRGTLPTRGAVAVLAVAGLLTLLAGCSSGSPDPGPSPGPSTTAGEGATATRPATSAKGKAFEDPQGEYTLTIGRTWKKVATPQGVKGLPGQEDAEYWTLGAAEKGFTPNVNVLTQEVPGVSLAAYKRISEGQTKQAKLRLVRSEVVTGASGKRIGVIEYEGDPTGAGRTSHFLATYAVGGGRAVVATLSTDLSTFKKHRTRVEPLLRSLALT